MTKKKQGQLSSWNFIAFKTPKQKKKGEKAKIFPMLQIPACQDMDTWPAWELEAAPSHRKMGIQGSCQEPDKNWDINETLQSGLCTCQTNSKSLECCSWVFSRALTKFNSCAKAVQKKKKKKLDYPCSCFWDGSGAVLEFGISLEPDLFQHGMHFPSTLFLPHLNASKLHQDPIKLPKIFQAGQRIK